MSIFKCKMCGGTLEINGNETVATCEYCGTQQTLPKLDNERRVNLYDRANHFRRNNEYDKAANIYEQILNEDNSDAEAYWSLVLCKYGIEYVEDPSSHKRIPTVNRAQFTSIFDDDNYKSAIRYADSYQKIIYENEARAINEIQKGILAISQKEEPFDVFICYKETDNNGRRTPDSVLANDLYHQLTQEGFKVFFSRITLEDKLGTAYEPYIFAALNSAKVMVVLGTKPEYFNAVWVKNEWSRYLALVKQSNGKKILIPAYKDMDPYDLPEEFSHLQAQDMSKLGFMQDLIRGIKKITQVEDSKVITVRETVTSSNTSTEPLLKRVFMFLEDSDWNSANEYCEKVLDIDPENAIAYLGKLMTELHVSNVKSLKNQTNPFDENSYYQKAIRFGNEKLREALTGYAEECYRNSEIKRKDNILSEAILLMDKEDETSCQNAIKLFESIPGWKDADEKAVYCRNKIEEIKAIEEEKRLELDRKKKHNTKIITTIVIMIVLISTLVIALNTVIIPNKKYNDAIAAKENGNYSKATELFEEIKGYKDSEAQLQDCTYSYAIESINNRNYIEAYEALTSIDGYKDSIDIANSIYDRYKYEKLKNAKVGDYVYYGSYEQDWNRSNGKEDIEWLVLDIKDNKVLLISKYGLDYQPYYDTFKNITWENSSARAWLNNDFISKAFTEYESGFIPTVTVSTDVNPKYNTNPGNETQDKIFLLSIDEANRYFNSDSDRVCQTTEFATKVGANKGENGNTYWWLRTPGKYQNFATRVNIDGSIDEIGSIGNYDHNAIRPALWIDLGAIE